MESWWESFVFIADCDHPPVDLSNILFIFVRKAPVLEAVFAGLAMFELSRVDYLIYSPVYLQLN